jgi:hypothetical protein
VQTQTAVEVTADLPSASTARLLFYPIWPRALIAFGLALTSAWTCLLGYGLIKLVELAF